MARVHNYRVGHIDIINLNEYKEANSPHVSGAARCLECHHEWVAVAPLETRWLDCPTCGLEKGRFLGAYQRSEARWVCNCGNDLFYVFDGSVFCPNCGESQRGI